MELRTTERTENLPDGEQEEEVDSEDDASGGNLISHLISMQFQPIY
jgi:hypothetical protein